jgi:CDP-diacylglycerol--glycerol-3-phosphate 3-phosphatidyltransferase
MIWNIPNCLTILRFLLVPVFIAFVQEPGFHARSISLVVFFVAALTDFLDGRIARWMNQRSEFGKFADPLADKFLVAAALISFVRIEETLIPVWMVFLILAREFIVTGLRVFLISRSETLDTSNFGKAKTTAQMVSISVILVLLVARAWVLENPGAGIPDWITEYQGDATMTGLRYLPAILMSITVFLTVISGVRYFMLNRKIFGRTPEE